MTVAAVCAFLFWIVVFLRGAAFARLPTLRNARLPGRSKWPKVSVIVPSRNEEESVEVATKTLLAQDYPDFEIVAVNDRSSDATGRILDQLAASHERLRVVHLTDLPSGWLGKNNAMRQGALKASGEWLLFTDGDVMFEPGALRRAVAVAEHCGLGHFIALPHMVAEGFAERAFISAFIVGFSAKFPLAELARAGSRAFLGVGAFGLVKREAYDSVGGHERLAFEVADDVKLGLILRRSAVPQGCLDSDGLVRVRWQRGFLATLRGLEKNAFAGLEWNTSFAVVASLVLLLLAWAPFVALLCSSDDTIRATGGVALLIQIAMGSASARTVARGSGLEGLFFPMSLSLLALVLLGSTTMALLRGGIVWRGTFYPLSELRRRCVRERDWDHRKAVGWNVHALQ